MDLARSLPEPRERRTAFTVIELMLAVSIMGVIIFALYSVFNQTQRALRSTRTQGDVAEKARAIVDIISRELEQAHPTYSAVRSNNIVYQEVNMLGGFESQAQYKAPRVQASDRSDLQPRTNFFHDLFFFTNHTNAWQGIGYRVVYVTNGVGVLERFETNQFGFRPVFNQLSDAFQRESLTNITYHHVADGIVHLTFIPYDAQGRRLGFDTTNRAPSNYKILRRQANLTALPPPLSDVTSTNLATVILDEAYPNSRVETRQYAGRFSFRSNAVPAYVDLELALLEPDTLAQYYLMLQDENPNAASYLAKQMAKVHLFRKRIPIRTAAQ